MSVRDCIGPVGAHHIGLPPQLMTLFKTLRYTHDPRALNLGVEVYEGILKTLDKVLSGDVPVDEEAHAAKMAAHLILDAAFVHDSICAAGYPAGKFPYDDLALKLFPPNHVAKSA